MMDVRPENVDLLCMHVGLGPYAAQLPPRAHEPAGELLPLGDRLGGGTALEGLALVGLQGIEPLVHLVPLLLEPHALSGHLAHPLSHRGLHAQQFPNPSSPAHRVALFCQGAAAQVNRVLMHDGHQARIIAAGLAYQLPRLLPRQAELLGQLRYRKAP